jgi:diaminopimelate decarboxylase
MAEKTLPFSESQIKKIIKKYPTPFHIYDETGIKETAKKLNNEFSWIPGFREYFAVKATPNPFILKILHEEGFGADCSSLPELILAEKVGIKGDNIMFTSNDTPAREYKKARKLGAIINLDDISHIEFLEKHIGLPDRISFRYNPGPLRKGSNSIIGQPEEQKYGFTRKQLLEGYKIMKNKGVKKFGLHTMIASNEPNPNYFVETANMLFELVSEISHKLNIRFEFVNMGGGIGIPYKPEQEEVDLKIISDGIKKIYYEKFSSMKPFGNNNGLAPIKLFMENGRMITGPHGYLVSSVLHKKEIYKNYIGLDASMANLMRPAMYGAYHHITVLGKRHFPHDQVYDVTGSLCENNDKFAINRKLPKIDKGDIVVIHDSGAHGHAMGFNYNGKLRSAELLLKPNCEVEMIRRPETIKDYFATLNFSKLKKFIKN